MRILFILLLGAATMSFARCPWKLVYTNGHELAVLQDSLLEKIKAGEPISKDTIRDLRINWWVKTARHTAPGNLILRQYCIIDLARDKVRHHRRITKLLDTLSVYSKSGKYRTWAEGYSYWRYTNDALSLWIERFKDEEISAVAEAIDSCFAYTSYRAVDGLYYPAPFGDLRKEPLDIKGQNLARRLVNMNLDAHAQNIRRNVVPGKIEYHIMAMPIGMNNHCNVQNSHYEVINGELQGFKWYEGYDKKYKSKEAEWMDILDPRRLITLPFIW